MDEVIRFNDKDFFHALEEKKRMFAVGSKMQQFVDSEVLRLMNPYTPMDTGALVQSATNGTVIGSGKIQYTHLMQDTCIMVKYMALIFQ